MFSEIWPNIIRVLDGTYIYYKKNSDFDAQKESFNGKKNKIYGSLWQLYCLMNYI